MKNVSIVSDYSELAITLYADPEILLKDYAKFEAYIKGVEKVVRSDRRYTSYISKVKSAGLDRCAVLGDLKEDSKTKLEMHHGPIFTLFDICEIILKCMFKDGVEDITTFKVADVVLTEHENDNIQIVMLSKGVHKGKHNYLSRHDIFIQIKASIGRIDRFIRKYDRGMDRSHFEALGRYIELCKRYPASVDNGLFDTSENLISFKKK